MSMEMMDGTWREHIMHVLKLDEEEIPLWEKIAAVLPSHHCRHLVMMMVRSERDESRMLRELLEEHHPAHPGPGYYGPGYGPPGFDLMPYSEQDKEKK